MTVVAITEALQGVSRAADHAWPIPGSGLAKLAHQRIPRTVVPISGPKEAGIETVQDPNRFAQRTGQMRDRSIDRHDGIEQRDHRGGIGEIGKLAAEMNEVQKLT